jgi:putative ABC transport system permease protein
VAVILSTSDAKSRAEYTTELRAGQAGMIIVQPGPDGGSGSGNGSDSQQLADAVAAQLPTKQVAVQYRPIYTRSAPVFPEIVRLPANNCPYHPSDEAEYHATRAAYLADLRCHNGGTRNGMSHLSSATFTAGGPELLKVLTGAEYPEAEAVLRQGGVVVFDPLDLTTPAPHATVTITARTYGTVAVTVDGRTMLCPGSAAAGQTQPAGCPAATPDQTLTLPAAVVPAPLQTGQAIVALGALDKLGLKFTPMNLLVDTTRMPTADEEEKADSAAAALGVQEQLYVERGYQGGVMIGLLALAAVAGVITLGAAAVATGLAIADAQSDLETLVAVGARPRVRRVLAGSQSAVTTGLGAVLGSAFGLLPAIGLIETQAHSAQQAMTQFGDQIATANRTYLTVPWLFLGVVILALPLLAAAGAAGLTRSRIELRRRRA